MEPEPRPELRELAPALHGGDAPEGVLDFSTGISPLPVPPAILDAARAADVTRYPNSLPLRERIAEVSGVSVDRVVVGAGSTELIWALARAFAGPDRHAVVFAPAFAEYAQAVRASGARVVEVRAHQPPFLVSVDAAFRALQTRPSLAFVCRPANPGLSSLPFIEDLAGDAPGTLFVVDEAYLPLFQGVEPVARRPNIVVLRSLTKVFALAGLRLGYLLAAPSIAQVVQAALPPWNVSAPALAAGLVAIEAPTREIAGQIAELRQSLAQQIAAPIDAAGGPFLLVRAAVAERLLAEGIRVRDCASFGLPEHIRIGVRPPSEQAQFAEAWKKIR